MWWHDDEINTLGCIFIVLAPRGHLILILSQPVFVLSLWLTRAGLEPTVYYTRGSKHYATDAVVKNIRARLCKLQKGCIRLAAASHKVYQLSAHGRWFSPGTPASSTTKTGSHDIAEILLKVASNTINQQIRSIWKKYMNEYFEYMTGYAVLILRAYIKMGVFLTSRVTTLNNCTKG